jgi:hypothetical protein
MTSPQRQGGESTQKTANGQHMQQQKHPHDTGKSKAVPLHAMVAHGGDRSRPPTHSSALDGSEWSASRPGRALHPGKRYPIPIVQESGWASEPVWTQRLEEKSYAAARDRNPIARASSP